MLTTLHDEITANNVSEAGFELSKYHLLCLIDVDGKTYTRAYAYCMHMGEVDGGGAWATCHWTAQQVAAANYRHAVTVTCPLHRRNAVK